MAFGSRKRSTAGHWLWIWLPVLLGVAIIMLESTPLFGADHTDGPLRELYESLLGGMRDDLWGQVHVLLRKIGHFVFFGLIAVAWVRSWLLVFPRWRFLQASVVALFCTALVSCADEIHQRFLANRTGRFEDVLIDLSGACALLLVAGAGWHMNDAYRQNRRHTG